ncbi:MAG: DUF6141 family protein [Bacteroidales bacterium]|jgi:hypothetical protein|nr:DUF6141 family protein [Bacteroidales bacterium]
MKTYKTFTETQRFGQWWIWLILLGLNGLFIYGIIQQIILGHPFGDKPMNDTGLFLVFGVLLLITFLFVCVRLQTYIDEDGVYVRFFPFRLTYKRYAWAEISKSYVKQYRPLLKFGGWGLRYNFSFSEKAYSVSGRNGLQLELVSGKKVLIGTNKPEELTEILISLGKQEN